MLVDLHIENVAVIEKADISLKAGFHVLTGETGAGKSIVIDAINAVLGERISRALVRTGKEQAYVTALFDELSDRVVSFLNENGYAPEEDGTLLISRQITSEGKGAARINGRPASVSVIRQLGRMLVNIHGQHENQNLLSPETHVTYLDKIGHLEEQHRAYYASYREYCRIHKLLKACNQDEETKNRRADLLRFQIGEIEDAALQADEEFVLQEKRDFFRNSEKIADSLTRATAQLCGDDEEAGAVSAAENAARELTVAGTYDKQLAGLSARMDELALELRAVSQEVRLACERLDWDASERDRVEERIDLINRLSSKYGKGTAAILEYCQKAQDELSAIVHAAERQAELEEQLGRAEEQLVADAAALTAARKEAAVRFAAQVAEELRFLDMPRVQFEVSITPDTLNATGGDNVEFLLSANAGEPVKPLAKIASGGELSRIMLAIKSVMADADDVDTLVFDEIDVGISGRAAQKVGTKLREIAQLSTKRCQVVCVTHLAQIAAQAHHHFLINKSVVDDRTYTQVLSLDREAREQELARIIGGAITPTNLQAAREMLESQN